MESSKKLKLVQNQGKCEGQTNGQEYSRGQGISTEYIIWWFFSLSRDFDRASLCQVPIAVPNQ